MTSTPKHIRQVIEAVVRKQARELDLSGLKFGGEGLTEIPPEVFPLEHLEVLILRRNRIHSIPEEIKRLRNLTVLDLADNQISLVPDSISDCQRLAALSLRNNKLTKVPESISDLENLSDLKLDGNRISSFDSTIRPNKRLTSLSIKNNEFTQVPEFIASLENLAVLDLSKNKLKSVPKWIAELKRLRYLGLAFNQFELFPLPILRLRNLTELDLRGNQLTNVPKEISDLVNLSILLLGENGINTLPDGFSQLNNLTILSFSNNPFTAIPPTVYELDRLEELEIPRTVENINNNVDRRIPTKFLQRKETNYVGISEISPRLLRLKRLRRLDLSGQQIQVPPPEIVKQGLAAIKNYFRQLNESGTDHLYEAKLLILGEGGAGKTSLARKIQNPDYQLRDDERSTEGIEVIRVEFALENGNTFRMNIWDFGGQEIYHATHQFFLTKRSLYVLVADSRKEDTDFYYWLNIAELLSDSSPIFIVENQKQDRHREINENQLRAQFTNLIGTLPTNLATRRGLPELIGELKHQISKLPHIGTPLPKTWIKVREKLEQEVRNHISLEEYVEICEENGFAGMSDKLQLCGYLHDLGICLHFQDDPLLKKTVILKPKWGTDAVYAVLDNRMVRENRGQFVKSDLALIWNEPKYANMLDELLQLMINFKLCYKIPETIYYIAPQLLSENQPIYDWDEANNLILRYTYEFMPKGILTQFIVAMHTLIAEQNLVWKSGVILKKDQTQAEIIEFYGRREVRIRLVGKHKTELLTIISYELDKIHRSYNRLRLNKMIPCNCSTCQDNQEPYFYKFEILQKFIEDRQRTIQCQKSYQMVSVRSLMDDVAARAQTESVEEPATGAMIFHGPVGMVVQAEQVGDIMKNEQKKQPRSAWANGSFYLVVFAVVITGLAVVGQIVSAFVLPLILIAGVLFVPIIGALQLRQDDKLSQKSFLELMGMTIRELPLISRASKERNGE